MRGGGFSESFPTLLPHSWAVSPHHGPQAETSRGDTAQGSRHPLAGQGAARAPQVIPDGRTTLLGAGSERGGKSVHKCIRRVVQLLSWSVRAPVEPGQLPAAEICWGGGKKGTFSGGENSSPTQPWGRQTKPWPAKPPKPLSSEGDGAVASHKQGDAVVVRGGGAGGSLLASVQPLQGW